MATKQASITSDLDTMVTDLAKRAKLNSWNQFIEELKVPSEIFPALASMRPELLKLAPRVPLTAEQADALYNVIGGLMETNQALQQHASHLSTMVGSWSGLLKGLQSSAVNIRKFAAFSHDQIDTPEDDD